MVFSYLIALFIRDPLIIVATALMGTINLLASHWDKDGSLQLRIARKWARMLLGIAGARVTVTGLEHIDPARSYVVSPNHVSYMDTPVLLGHLPVNFRFLAKKGLFDIPFIGGHLTKAGHIAVPLDDPRAALKVLSSAGHAMKERGLSVLVFPEGGRSEDGNLQPFKDGAAYLAIKGAVPILPIALIGLREILPMHSHHMRPGKVTMRIGPPLETEGLPISARVELTERLAAQIRALHDQGHAD
ncbi:MAG TPA: 1-acyl-sn-glycerol-3-phosphate acyltransferase [Solibacterales bacterium]|nr:1-acyl-sn-glycerol-3-phosphate acyltransferase [Bryobacterales bacterium]